MKTDTQMSVADALEFSVWVMNETVGPDGQGPDLLAGKLLCCYQWGQDSQQGADTNNQGSTMP